MSASVCLLHQHRMVDLAGSVIQDRHQVVPALILKTLVMAAVDMQRHARQRTTLTAPAMHAAPSSQQFARGHGTSPAAQSLRSGRATGNTKVILN